MASLAAIRAALAETIGTAITSLSCYDTVPESVNTPAAMVVPRSTDFDRTFGRGLDAYSLDVIVLVSRTDDRLAQDTLDPYVNGFGDLSVRQAVWNGRDLGIGVEARVTGMTDYGGTYDFAGVSYAGARLAVEVLTSGTA